MPLNPWLTLILGIAIGWLLAWLLGRGSSQSGEQAAAQLREQLAAREREAAEARQQLAGEKNADERRLARVNAELEQRRADLAAAEHRLNEQQSKHNDLVSVLNGELDKCRSELAQTQARLHLAQEQGAAPAAPAPLAEPPAPLPAATAFAEPLAPAGEAAIESDWEEGAGVAAPAAPDLPETEQQADDLTALEGIGPAYAAKLHEAGIMTFAQLASAGEETLRRVIAAPDWRKVSYADWIAQARLAAAGDSAGLKELQDKLFSRGGDR